MIHLRAPAGVVKLCGSSTFFAALFFLLLCRWLGCGLEWFLAAAGVYGVRSVAEKLGPRPPA